MKRVVERGNIRVVQRFRGDPANPREMDDPRKWEDVGVALAENEVLSDWVKLATDIAVTVNPRGGLVLDLGGLRVGIHEDQVEEALLTLGDAVAEARAARQNAKTAREAAQAIAAAAEAARAERRAAADAERAAAVEKARLDALAPEDGNGG